MRFLIISEAFLTFILLDFLKVSSEWKENSCMLYSPGFTMYALRRC